MAQTPRIAVRLGLSPETVKTHIATMLGKLGLEDRRELAAWRPEQKRPRVLAFLARPASLASVGRPLLWAGSALAGAAVVAVAISCGSAVIDEGGGTPARAGTPATAETRATTETGVTAGTPTPAETGATAGTPTPAETPATAPRATAVELGLIDPAPPCGTGPFDYGDPSHQGFLEWAHGGQVLLVGSRDKGPRVGIDRGIGEVILGVHLDGSRVVTLSDERYANAGFHADASEATASIVFSTCNFSSEDKTQERPPAGTRARAVHEHKRRFRTYYHYEIATLEGLGAPPTRLTDNDYLDHFPVWSPDGTAIALVASTARSDRGPSPSLFTMAADGTERLSIVPSLEGSIALAPPVWSPDGQRLAFLVSGWEDFEENPWNPYALYTVSADGSDLQRVGRVSGLPSWSPDSQFLAFARSSEGDRSLYISRHDGSGQRPAFQERIYRGGATTTSTSRTSPGLPRKTRFSSLLP